jgi:hypothetical protein
MQFFYSTMPVTNYPQTIGIMPHCGKFFRLDLNPLREKLMKRVLKNEI